MDDSYILVIDDDPDILDALQMTLENEGYIVKTSQKVDYVERLFHSDQKKPDLIILDVLLSGQDGRTICKMLKNRSDTGHIPIIMISAHPNVEKTVKEVGADAFLAKPFDIESLLKNVGKHGISVD